MRPIGPRVAVIQSQLSSTPGNLCPVSGPTSFRWRLLRSAAFAVVAAQLAALGHLVGGGGSPDPAVLLVGAATVGAVATGLTRSRRSWSAIFGVLVACQLGFHLLFSVDVHDMAAGRSMVPADPVRMLTFHLIAAAVSALVLAKGEAGLFLLFAALRRYVRSATTPIVVDLPPSWTVSLRHSFAPRPVGALLSTSPRRGPPAAR